MPWNSQPLTPEQITANEASRESIKTFNRKYAGYKKTIKSIINDQGLREAELSMEFLLNNPNTQLPTDFLNYQQTVEVWREVIGDYKSDLELKNKKNNETRKRPQTVHRLLPGK